MNPGPRPRSVTVISWFLILTSMWGIVAAPIVLLNPVSRRMVEDSGGSPVAGLVLGVVAGVLDIAAGVGMLNGRRWGRRLYLVATPVLLALSAALQGTGSIGLQLLGLGIYGVFLGLLKRPPAQEYFSGATSVPSVDDPPRAIPGEPMTGRKLAGVFLLFPGGMTLATTLMVLHSMAGQPSGLIVLAIVGGGMAAAFVVPGIALWGRARWRAVLGTLFCCVGGLLLMMAAVFDEVSAMEEFRRQVAAVDPAMVSGIGRGSLLFGIGSLIVGPLLLVLQRERDVRR